MNEIIFICQNGKNEVSSNRKRTEIYKSKLALNLCILFLMNSINLSFQVLKIIKSIYWYVCVNLFRVNIGTK